MTEKKYTIKEIIGLAIAAGSMLGAGVVISPQAKESGDLREYVRAQTIRDSIKAEDMRKMSANIDTLNRQFRIFSEMSQRQNDSTRWAIKQLSQSIQSIDKNAMRYGYICDGKNDKIARQ